MAITVVIARDDVGSPTTREVYADGAKFTMDQGNLDIISSRPQLLATYGSGNWLSVHVDDFVEVQVTRPPEDSDSGGGGFDFGASDFGSDDDTPDLDSTDTDTDSDDVTADDSEDATVDA